MKIVAWMLSIYLAVLVGIAIGATIAIRLMSPARIDPMPVPIIIPETPLPAPIVIPCTPNPYCAA